MKIKPFTVGVSIVCLIFFIAVCAWTWHFFFAKPQVSEVNITYVCPSDSANAVEILEHNKRQTERLTHVIQKQEEQLQEHYKLFLKAREEDADIVRMLSCLGAFVLAIAAIFGIKSFKDLQAHIEKDATETAKETAEEIAAKKAPEVVENFVKSQVQEQLKKQIDNSSVTASLTAQIEESVMNNLKGMFVLREEVSTEDDETPSADDSDNIKVDQMPPISDYEPKEK